ncbi:anti-sigma factor family protein [Luteococcus sp. OSA5]|uniref:anti-sigma factor family protein n=1 Tax=Luteococcus sp. OSA5 TaxID=3401630 RepID=UPI003B431EC7
MIGVDDRACRSFRKDLTAYADQALDDERREQVANHLVDCGPCRDELRELNQVCTLLGIAARSSEPRQTPNHLADRLVAIAGDQADECLWLAPERDGTLPSLRRRRRNKALAGLSMTAAGVVGALGGLTMMAPELPVVVDLDASQATAPLDSEDAPKLSRTAPEVDVDSLGTRVASSVSIGALAERRLVQRRLDQCPDEVQCPEQLLGLPLTQLAVDSDSDPSTARTVYRNGEMEIVVVQQHGRLQEAAPGHDECAEFWQSGEWVYCLQSSNAAAAQLAAQLLPHDEPVTGEGMERVRLGLRALVGERGR